MLTDYVRSLRSPNGMSQTRPSDRRRGPLQFERLQPRELFVVGAFDVPDEVTPGTGFDGVVSVLHENGVLCSGTLLGTGRHILTAAHCLDRGDSPGTVAPGKIDVQFELPSGTKFLGGMNEENVFLHPTYVADPDFDNADIAILELPEVAPAEADRYEVFRDRKEAGRWAYLVGFGLTGDSSGVISQSFGTKRMGTNFLDRSTGPQDRLLEFDFDKDPSQWAPGQDEVMGAGGDSGGPALLWGPSGLEVAGVMSSITGDPSAFGTKARVTRVSSFAGWIDQQTQGAFDVLINMANQGVGNNGRADTIRIDDFDQFWTITINGYVALKATHSDVRSITLVGSLDNERVQLNLQDSTNTPITLHGGLGFDDLAINRLGAQYDSILLGDPTVTVNSNQITYAQFETLDLDAGHGNDTILVRSPSGHFVDLNVYGSSGNDQIDVDSSEVNSIAAYFGGGGQDRLTIRDESNSVGDEYTLTQNRLSIRSEFLSQGFDGFEEMLLRTGSGSDTVRVPHSFQDMSLIVMAGDGNDTLVGGAGNEVFVGGDGQDQIEGNGGRDLIFGGLGADILDGGAHQDIVIDGTTHHDHRADALFSLLREWQRTDQNYRQRIAALRHGGGWNGSNRLDSLTVASDNDVDTLAGGTSLDWFWGQYWSSPFNPTVRDQLEDIRLIGAYGTTEQLR